MMDSTEEFVREGIDRFTTGARVPAGLAASAVRQHRRRRAALRGGLGTGVAAVAAVAVSATTWLGSPAPAGIKTTAFVVARVSRALGSPGLRNMVEEVSVPAQMEPVGKGRHVPVEAADTWEYRGSSRANVYGSDGKLSEMLWSRSSVVVSKHLRAWSVVLMAKLILPGSNGCVWPGHTVSSNLFFPTATFVKTTLRCGGLAVAGHLRIGDEQMIRLVTTSYSTLLAPITLYVSPETYLPVRVVQWGITANIRWLAPAPAILDLLKTHIPAGFRQIPQSRFFSPDLWQWGLPSGIFAAPTPHQS